MAVCDVPVLQEGELPGCSCLLVGLAIRWAPLNRGAPRVSGGFLWAIVGAGDW